MDNGCDIIRAYKARPEVLRTQPTSRLLNLIRRFFAMSEVYHDAQLPSETPAKRSYTKGPFSKDNPPTEIRYCKKCGSRMSVQWDSAPQYKSRWRYRCEPCRRKHDPDFGKKKYQREIQRNPNSNKERHAIAKQRNPHVSRDRSRRALELHPERVRVRQRKNRMAQYGLTEEQYIVMYDQQCGICAICGRSETNKPLVIDHDHTTGQVRALLCSKCNLTLGFAEDNAENLRAMADYLDFHCNA